MQTVQTDVVVVGGGGAGLRAAIAVAQSDPRLKIALVSKVVPMRSHTVAAEGGSAGAVREDDSLQSHFDDTVGGGDWLSDQDAVDYFIAEAPKELLQLERWGCPWSREPDGSVAVRPFGGMKLMRTWFAADKSGFHILHTLFQTSLKYPSIQRFDEYYATELLVEDGRCRGLTAIEMRSGQMRRFDAGAVAFAACHLCLPERDTEEREDHDNRHRGGRECAWRPVQHAFRRGVAGSRDHRPIEPADQHGL